MQQELEIKMKRNTIIIIETVCFGLPGQLVADHAQVEYKQEPVRYVYKLLYTLAPTNSIIVVVCAHIVACLKDVWHIQSQIAAVHFYNSAHGQLILD